MRRRLILAALCGLAWGATGCASEFRWELPVRFPMPKVPADNPMSDAKVELGRRLFYDPRLSLNQTQSCASCHRQELAFTDGLANALGSTGVAHRRSALGLGNVAYYSATTWANPILTTLERQAAVPLLGSNPIELGFGGHEVELFERLSNEPLYPPLFRDAFGADATITLDGITKALAAFERTLLSGDAPYDRFVAGDVDAISESAKRGASLFLGERLECHHCHGTFAFSNSVTWAGRTTDELFYQNDALYNVDGAGAYPSRDRGLIEISLRDTDEGRFRPPSLRNIAVTAPYMHDGSVATLRAVILEHYARGGRLLETGPDAGDGAKSPRKASLVSGFAITEDEVDDLLAFLDALTDDAFLTNERHANPW